MSAGYLILCILGQVLSTRSELHVEVNNVTTSTVRLEWSPESQEMEFNLRLLTEDPKPGITWQSPINFGGLKNGQIYEIRLNSSSSTWKANISFGKCPEGMIGIESSCFWSPLIRKTWESAVDVCRNFSARAHLANPQTWGEAYSLPEVLHSPDAMYWIGVNDRMNEGDFVFSDSRKVPDSLKSNYWQEGSPNSDIGNEEDCVVVLHPRPNHSRLKWNDMECARELYFICQYPIIPSPNQLFIQTTPNSAALKWAAPVSFNESQTSHFKITIESTEGSQDDSITTDTQWTAVGLKSGHIYSASIMTVDAISDDNFVYSGTFPSTYFATNPYPVESFNAVNITPTTAHLNWAGPQRHNDSLFSSFLIHFRTLNKSIAESSTFSLEGQLQLDSLARTTTLLNLEPHRDYVLRIITISNHTTPRGWVTSESESTSLSFSTPLAPPRSLHVNHTSITEESFEIAWKSAVGLVEKYRIVLKTKSADETKILVANNFATSYFVDGLSPGESYEIAMISLKGIDQSSAVFVSQTTRPLPPKALTVEKPQSSSVNISIIFNRERDGKVSKFDGFNLTFTSPDDSMVWRIPVDYLGGETYVEATVEGLTPGQTYVLTTVTTQGSASSYPIKHQSKIIMDMAPPGNFRMTSRGETEITLGWDPAPGVQGVYMVRCEGFQEPCPAEVDIIRPDEKRELRVGRLKPGARYNFTIQTQNGQDISKAKRLSLITVPRTPLSLDTVSRSDTSISLRWDQPTGILDGYKISYTSRGGQLEILFVQPGIFEKTLNNLRPGTYYEISLVSTSSEIESEPIIRTEITELREIENLSIARLGETWAFISWVPGEGGYSGFDVSLDGNSPWFVESTSFNITTLLPITQYIVEVSTVLDKDRSVARNITIQTRPLPPNDVRMDNLTKSSVHVWWREPETFDQFLLVYKDDFNTKNLMTQQTSVDINDLTPGSSYVIDICVIFKSVKSYNVTNEITTYPISPDVHILHVGTENISIRWEESSKSIVGHYVVSVEPSQARISTMNKSITLVGLTPGVKYNISVSSFSGNGEKESQNPNFVTQLTKESKPGTPTALVLKPVSTTELLTEWEIPLNPNGIIRRYIIRFKQNYPHPSTNYTLIETNQTRYLLKSLEPGAEYVALFAAVNSAGVGNFTESYLFKMPESRPGPVSDLHVSFVNATSATVAWQPPEQPNGEIIRYVLNISTDNLPVLSVDLLKRSNSDKNLCLFDHKSKSDKTALVSVTSSLQNNSVTEAFNDEIKSRNSSQIYFDPLCPVFVNVTSLLPFTLYRFRVTAWTSSGRGIPVYREEMTLEDVPDDPPRHVRLTSATHTSLNVTWYPPNQPNGIVTYTIAVLQSDKMFQSNLTYYDINELRPFTKYGVMVRAETSVGVSPWSEILFADTQQGRPGSVQNLTAQVETSRSVTLQWNPPINPNGVITGYWIFAKVKNVTQLTLWLEGGNNGQAGLDEINELTVGSKIRNYSMAVLTQKVLGLIPYTEYQFIVAAHSTGGSGVNSGVNLTTLQDVPSSPPINLSYYNVSSTAVNITWDEPLEANGVITKYVVYYMTKDTFLDVTVTERFALIKDLKIFSPYEVRVRPYTMLGDGPASGTLLIHTDEDFPASPVRNVTSKNITSSVVELSWTPPLIINGRARSYTVFYSNSTSTYNITSNQTSAFLTNLRVFTAYKVQVACQTKKGLGNILSKAIFIQTEEGQPATPPFNVSYQNLTSTKVRLTWRRPLVPNGIIQFYEISLTSKNNKTIRATTENDVTAVTVDHLTAYSEYTATVRANTKFGDGSQQSHALTIHTLEDVPGSPVTNVTYVNLTSSSIGLEWSLPKEPNGKILKYSIRYSMLEGNMNQYKAVNDTFVELFDLNKYTRYNVSISAHTVAGEGPPAYISLHTDEDEPESAPYDIIFQQYNSTTIALTWRPPVKPNGVIVNYTVYYSNEDKVMTKTTTKPRTVLRNLEKFTEYEVYLTASTKLGNGGKKSAIETFQTLEDAPADPPRDVVVKALSSTSISVGWSTPATPNGRIQFYTVFYTDKISAVHATNITNGTNAVIKDLNKYSDYLVWVSGSTALGDGNQLSDAKKVRTMEDVPGAPSNCSCYALNESALVVSWRTPFQLNGVILGYRVGVPAIGVHYMDMEITRYNVTGLTPFTTYNISISARTEVGFGPSSLCSGRTNESVPGPPIKLDVLTYNDTSSQVTWYSPVKRNGIIKKYEVEIASKNITRSHFVLSNSRQIDFLKLLKYSLYKVRCSAYTNIGQGPWSEWISFTTLPGVPDNGVSDLSALAINATTIKVTWQPGIPLTGPTFFHIQVEGFPEYFKNETRNLTYIFDLKPHTEYVIKVYPRVVGVYDAGPVSSIVVTTMESAPSSPVQNLHVVYVTETIVKLKWKPPSEANGVITSYTITVTKQNYNKTKTGNETETVIEDLRANSHYNVSVTSSTKIGESPSTILLFRTKEGVPQDAVTDIQLINLTSDSALIKWLAPRQPNGVITHYTVHYGRNSTIQTNVTEATLRDLHPFQLYWIEVYPWTSAGIGVKPSEKMAIKTKESAPTAPTALNCSVASNFSVKISWDLPMRSNGIIRGYNLEYRSMDKNKVKFVQPSQTKQIISNLKPFANYLIKLRAINLAGKGQWTHCNVTTLEGYADAPPQLQLKNVSDRSITIEWSRPLQWNGRFHGYLITYKPPDSCPNPANDTVCSFTSNLTSVTLEALSKYRAYNISVGSITGRGVGTMRDIIVSTLVGVPDSPVRDVHVTVVSSTSINVTWNLPSSYAGPTTYKVTTFHSRTMQKIESPVLAASRRFYIMSGLDEDTTYGVIVTTMTTVGELSSIPVSIDTKEDAPSDFPESVGVATVLNNSSSVHVLFKEPLDPNGKLTNYTIQHRRLEDSKLQSIVVSVDQLTAPTTEHEPYSVSVSGLLGGRYYQFRVRAATAVGNGPWSLWTKKVLLPTTAPPVPDTWPEVMNKIDDTSTMASVTSSTITVKKPCMFSNENGPIASLSVIIAEDGGNIEAEPTYWSHAFPLQPSPPYKVLVSENPTAYCNTRKRRSINEKGFVIGTSDCPSELNTHCNGPLKSSTDYRVKFRAETSNGLKTDTEFSEIIRTSPSFIATHMTLLIGIGAAIGLFTILVVISAVFLRRRRQRFSNEPDESESPHKGPIKESFGKVPIMETRIHTNMAFIGEASMDDKVQEESFERVHGNEFSRPVFRDEFPNHVSSLSQNKNKGFSLEFDDIRGIPYAGTTAIAENSCNKTKNRTTKLVPFDHCRVKIEGIPAIQGSNYINASYIPGLDSPEQYIATQTPLDHTKKDFWRMLWETGSTNIVMLCGSMNAGKKRCDEFWPKKQTEYFGNLAVQMKEEIRHDEWIIRQFIVTMRDKVRHVTQHHFIKWPQLEQAANSLPLVRFIKNYRLLRDRSINPTIVMCSNGSGRCGVFIGLLRILDNNGRDVDVFGTVAALRKYRPYMVQTLSEYIYLHQCVLKFINDVTTEPLRRAPTGDGLEETVF